MNKIDFNIAFLECGKEKGNAILINEFHALTVKHCITPNIENNEEINLYYYKDGEYIPQCVQLVSTSEEEDGFALLKLSFPVGNISEIQLVNECVEPFHEYTCLGFNKNHQDAPVWRMLKSCGSLAVKPAEIICDMTFRDEAKEKSVAGLSGSPVLKNPQSNQIIGLISVQNSEDGQEITIQGISVLSQNSFLEKNSFEVRSILDDLSFVEGITQKEIFPQGRYSAFGTSANGDPLYNHKLNEIILLYRNGLIEKAFESLRVVLKESEADAVSNDIKAAYHLQLAIWLLEYKGKRGAAKKQFDKAKSLNASIDTRKFLALNAFYDNKIADSLKILQPIDSVEILNTYLQICINSNISQKAIEIYELYNNDFTVNETSFYLMSIASLAIKDFDLATAYIEKAIELNDKSAKYYLQKALVTYWRALPSYLSSNNQIYPAVFSSIVTVLTKDRLAILREAVDNFRRAYRIVDIDGGDEYKEIILGAWLSALTVSAECRKMMSEPEELLKHVNSFNAVLLIVQSFKGILSLNDHDISKVREKIDSDDQNSLILIGILANHYISEGNESAARSILFEYKELFKKHRSIDLWFEQICPLTTNEEKASYIEQIDTIDEITVLERRRLKTLYIVEDCLLEQQLVGIFDESQKMTDLLNLVSFYQKSQQWDSVIRLSDILVGKYENWCGYIYKIDALLKAKCFDEALELISQIERKSEFSFEKILPTYKLQALDGLGRYQEALSEGKEIFKDNPTEPLAHKLSDYSLLIGDKLGAIQFLSKVEESGNLSAKGLQRLSDLYSTVDKEKAVKYAKLFIEEDSSPQAKLWVYQHAASIGKSKELEYLVGDVFKNPSSVEGLQVLNIEDILKMIESNRVEVQKKEEAFLKAEISIHSILDSNGGCYPAFYFSNWDNHNLMLTYGAHDYENMNGFSNVILDISSCLMLYQLKLLPDVCEKYTVHIYPDLLPLLIRDQSNLIPPQEDLFQNKKMVFDICKNELSLKKVSQVLPDNLAEINSMNRHDAIVAKTASVNNALWISLHDDKPGITAEMFAEQFNSTKFPKNRILVNILALEKWYEEDILFDIAEQYELLITEEEVDQIEREQEARELQRRQSCLTEEIINALKKLISDGKISFLPHEEGTMSGYTDMMIAELNMAQSKQYRLCIDDRFIQSFANAEGMPIVGSMDIVKNMYLNGYLSQSKYYEVIRKIINSRVLYYFPDKEYILHCLRTIKYDLVTKEVKEPDRLYNLRIYLNYAFLKLEENGNHKLEQCSVSEKAAYFLQTLQAFRYLLDEIWKWEDDYDKKVAASNWVWMNIARHGMNLDQQNIIEKLNYAQLVVYGLLSAMSNTKSNEYIIWLSGIMDRLLNYDPDLFDNALQYVIDTFLEVCSNLQEETTKNIVAYKKAIDLSIASAIDTMPMSIKERLLQNQKLLAIFSQFHNRIISLDEDIYILESEWNDIVNEVYLQDPDVALEKEINGVLVKVKWIYEFSCVPCIWFSWNHKGTQKEIGMLTSIGDRLKVKNTATRLKEYEYVLEQYGYAEDVLTKKMFSKDELYLTAAELLCDRIQADEKYQKQFLCNAIEKGYLYRDDVNDFLVIRNREIFANVYDCLKENVSKEQDEYFSIPGLTNDDIDKCNNPLALLNLLDKQIKNGDDIDSLVEAILCYLTDKKTYIFGQIFIGVITIVFQAMDELFTNEPIKNKIVWTYIWSDKIMNILSEMFEEKLDIEEWGNEFFEKNGMRKYINDSTGPFYEEYMDPRNMSLFKICYIWPCKLLHDNWNDKHEANAYKFLHFPNASLFELHSNDVRSARDILVTSQVTNNTFKSGFYTKDYQEISFKLSDYLAENKNGELYRSSEKRQLMELLAKEQLEKSDLELLNRFSLQQLDHDEIEIIEKCMRHFVMDQDEKNIGLELYHTFLPYLPLVDSEFAKEYQASGYTKQKTEFMEDSSRWKQISEKAACLVKGEEYQPFVVFWEDLARDNAGKTVSFEFLYFLFMMQKRFPEEYREKIYMIRTLFASK